MFRTNQANFVAPSIETVSLAANVALPEDTRVSITDTDSKDGYPISGFTWLIFYKEQNYDNRDKAKADTLINMLWWVLHEGQELAKPLHYAPLPDEAVKKGEKILKAVTYNGTPLLK